MQFIGFMSSNNINEIIKEYMGPEEFASKLRDLYNVDTTVISYTENNETKDILEMVKI